MAEVMSQAMDFTKRKMRAESSTAERVILASTNGNSFTLEQVAEIQIPGNQMNTFMDWQSSYLKFTVTNNDGAAIELPGTGGAYNLIQKIEVLSAGQTLCSIDNYNKLVNMLSDMQLSQDYKNDTGSLLAGMKYGEEAADMTTTSIAAAASQTFCLPLHGLPMMSASKYWPLFVRDTIRVRITLASAANATVGAATSAEVQISPIELVCLNVRLNDQAFAALENAVDGKFNIVTNDYRNATSSIAAADTTFVANVAYSYISLDRVLFGFFPDENTALADSNGGRDLRNLSEYSFSVNGKHYPARKIRVSATNGAEPFAELINCSNALADVHQTGSLNRSERYLGNNIANTSDTTTSHFLAGINLEQVREHGAESLYSGISTLGGVSQIEGSFSAAGQACNLEAFGNFTVVYQVDTRGSNNWVYVA
jgi:hypothetical protein